MLLYIRTISGTAEGYFHSCRFPCASQCVLELQVSSVACHATTGPPKIGPPRPFMAATVGPAGPFAALQMVSPDQQWHRGCSPFATAGPPYNPAFITFLLNHSDIKN